MNDLTTLERSRVSVTFKRSSTKDGGEGFDIYVGEDADKAEADRVMLIALELRQQALAAIAGKSLEKQLEESLG